MRNSDGHRVRKWCSIAESKTCLWYKSRVDSRLQYKTLKRVRKEGDKEDVVVFEPDNTLVQPADKNLEGMWYVNDSTNMLNITYEMFSYIELFSVQGPLSLKVYYLRQRYCLFGPNYDTPEWKERKKQCEERLRLVPRYLMKNKMETALILGSLAEKKHIKPSKFVRLRSAEMLTGQAHESWWFTPYETNEEIHKRLEELLDNTGTTMVGGDVSMEYPLTERIGSFVTFLADMLHVRRCFMDKDSEIDKAELLTDIFKRAPLDYVPPAYIFNHRILDKLDENLQNGSYFLESTFNSVCVFYILNTETSMFIHKPVPLPMGTFVDIVILDMDTIIKNQFGDTFEDVCLVDEDTGDSLEYGKSVRRKDERAHRYLVIQHNVETDSFQMTTKSDVSDESRLFDYVERNTPVESENVPLFRRTDYGDFEATVEGKPLVIQTLYSKDKWKTFYCLRRCFYQGDVLNMDSNFRHSSRIRPLFSILVPRATLSSSKGF